jgi:hypothetical protein
VPAGPLCSVEQVSVVALARRQALKKAAEHRRTPLRGPGDDGSKKATIENIARLIPSDALAAYTTGLAFLVHEKSAYRWLWVAFVGAVAIALAVGVYRNQVLDAGVAFHWPLGLTATVLLAYAAYVFVIPGSPASDFSWYSQTLAGLVGVAANVVIIVIGVWRRDSL